jgi:hypothetical protein
MSFAQAKAEISKFSATQQEKLLAMLARFAAEREKNWDDELRRRHGEMLREGGNVRPHLTDSSCSGVVRFHHRRR